MTKYEVKGSIGGGKLTVTEEGLIFNNLGKTVEISFKDIKSIELVNKATMWKNGLLKFVYYKEFENENGGYSCDEVVGAFMFFPKANDIAEEACNHVQSILKNIPTDQPMMSKSQEKQTESNTSNNIAEELKQAKTLYDSGAFTEEEYSAMRKKILGL